MRRGFSPTKSKQQIDASSRRERKEEKRSISHAADYGRYFCHYNNAVYMGGMSAYKKHGKGILLHDDGAAAITEYLHDTPSGHTIVFRQNSITSVLIKSTSEYEIAYKVGRVIMKVPFFDSSHQAHGVGVLIDYGQMKIYELVFKRGALVEKILHLNHENNDDVFRRNVLGRVLGIKHEQAFDLTFDRPENMQVKLDGNKLTIGYFDEYGDIHGVAFKMYAENIRSTGEKSFYLKSLEKGYYRQSRLQTYGQKYFSNGNKYAGQFQQGQFHGHGILLCPAELKWVYGKFQAGKLSEVINSNNKRYTENDFKMWNQSLRHIHKRYRQRWIDLDIELPDELYIYKILKDAVQKSVTEVSPDYEEAFRDDKERLSRIQNQFEDGRPGDVNHSYVDNQLDKHYTVRSKPSKLLETPSRGSLVDRQNTKMYETPISRIDSRKTVVPEPRTPKVAKQQYVSLQHPLKMTQSLKFNEPPRAENEYRMQDPFRIQLIKVPYDEKEPVVVERQYNRRQLSPIRSERYYQPRRYSPYRYSDLPVSRRYPLFDDIQYKYRYNDPIDGVYRRTYLDTLERQRDKLNRLATEDSIYIDNLRRELTRSPVHRNYYSTPPKYDPIYGERYAGKIMTKRHFNYNQPTEVSARAQRHERINTSGRGFYPRAEDYDEDRRTQQISPSKNLKTSPSRTSPRHLEDNRSRNFLQNNYRYWS